MQGHQTKLTISLDCSSICFVGSRIGWVSINEIYMSWMWNGTYLQLPGSNYDVKLRPLMLTYVCTRYVRSHTKGRKLLARKRRRRGGAEPRLLRQSKTSNRARARGWEITVATHNVRTMAVDGTHGVGRAIDDVLSVYNRLGCDVIGLQETCIQPSPRWATRCTAAVSAVARMVGRKGKVK